MNQRYDKVLEALKALGKLIAARRITPREYIILKNGYEELIRKLDS